MPAHRHIVVSVVTRVVICAVVLGIAIVTLVVLKETAPEAVVSQSGTAVPRVLVMQAQAAPIQRTWQGFGTARAMDSANVPSRVTSTVIDRPEDIREGRSVTKGQLLVQLDDADFQRQLEIAVQAIRDIDAQLNRLEVEEQSWTRRVEIAAQDVELSRADFARVQEAVQRDAARQRELDQAQQRLNTAIQAEIAAREELETIAPRRASLLAQRLQEEATRKLAALNVERSRVVSPIDGVLQTVDVEIGENIAAGERVARVVNLSRIEVPLLLASSARALINIGDQVLLTSGTSVEQPTQATVTRLAPEDDPTTRTLLVYAEVQQQPRSSKLIAPGQFVQGTVIAGQEQSRWVVPRRAIDRERVMLIEDGRVKSQTVEIDFAHEGEIPSLGLPDRQWAVLKDPLPQGALVVVDSSRTLAEGSPAIAVKAAESTARAETIQQGGSGGSAQ